MSLISLGLYKVTPKGTGTSEQEDTGDNGWIQGMCSRDVRLVDKQLILSLWINRRQPGYILLRKVKLTSFVKCALILEGNQKG